VTDFSDSKQIITVSVSHGICDARSIGMFFEAWSNQYNGKEVGDVVCEDSWIPEAPAMMKPPVVESSGKPEIWLKTSLPFEGAPKEL